MMRFGLRQSRSRFPQCLALVVTRIGQYEMAYKMQASVPELTDFSTVFVITVPKHVLESYGPEVTWQGSFAYNCLTS